LSTSSSSSTAWSKQSSEQNLVLQHKPSSPMHTHYFSSASHFFIPSITIMAEASSVHHLDFSFKNKPHILSGYKASQIVTTFPKVPCW
jgi:hypothetical protein